MAAGLQRRRLRRLQEGGLDRARRAVALADPRVGDRLRQRQPEIEPVDEDLQHGRDDRRASRRAQREEGLAVAQHDRRRHRAARPLPALDAVRVRRRVEVEVGQLVVQEKAVTGNEQRRAPCRLDRERVRDDVAGLVGRRDVRRRSSSGLGHRGLAAQRRRAVERQRIAGRDGAGRCSVGDQVPACRCELLRQETAQRHFDEVRIAEVCTAVGECIARRFEVQVERVLAREGRERIALEDVQRLPDRRAAARRRAHAEDVEPAVADVCRRTLRCGVRREVGGRHDAGPEGVVRVRRDLRMRRCVHDRTGERTAVERVRATLRQQVVRLREVGIAEG